MNDVLVEGTVELVEVAAKKGILTMDNAIKGMAVVGCVATVYHGYKTGLWLIHKGREEMIKRAVAQAETLASAMGAVSDQMKKDAASKAASSVADEVLVAEPV